MLDQYFASRVVEDIELNGEFERPRVPPAFLDYLCVVCEGAINDLLDSEGAQLFQHYLMLRLWRGYIQEGEGLILDSENVGIPQSLLEVVSLLYSVGVDFMDTQT